MKKISGLFAVVGVVLSASLTAQAADLPPRPQLPPQAPAMYVPAVPPVYNWGGIYLGINGGYGMGTAKWTPSGGSNTSSSAKGGVVGGTLGFNYQINALVFGVESDFDFSGISGKNTSTLCSITGNCQTGNTWLSTLRGRFGFAADRVLFYGTAGGVFANQQISAGGVTTTHTQAGWTAGVGIETAFAENWTAKLEYLYANLGSGNVTCTTVCGGVATTVAVSQYDNLIRAGVNYKFNF